MPPLKLRIDILVFSRFACKLIFTYGYNYDIIGIITIIQLAMNAELLDVLSEA